MQSTSCNLQPVQAGAEEAFKELIFQNRLASKIWNHGPLPWYGACRIGSQTDHNKPKTGKVNHESQAGEDRLTRVAVYAAKCSTNHEGSGCGDCPWGFTGDTGKETGMLGWSVTFLLIAILAGLVGFTGVAGTAT